MTKDFMLLVSDLENPDSEISGALTQHAATAVTTAVGPQVQAATDAAGDAAQARDDVLAAQANINAFIDARISETPEVAAAVADVVTARDLLTAATAAAEYAPVDAVPFHAGRVVAFAGDSHTVGTGSTNSSVTSFRSMTLKVMGTAKVAAASINGGVAGERSDQIAARVPGMIDAGAQVIYFMGGTNDAGQDVPLATFQTTLTALKATCDEAAVPLVVGLVPPRASTTTAEIHTLTLAYNMWLRLWAPFAGVRLVDTWTPLVDKVTGYLAAANDSGDGVHLSDAGHLAVAKAVAATLGDLIPAPGWPVSSAVNGLFADPLITATSHWTVRSGTAGTVSLVPDDGTLPVGQWLRYTIDNTAGGAAVSGARGPALNSAKWVPGDTILVAAYLRTTEPTRLKLQIGNQTGAAFTILSDNFGVTDPGPLLRKFVVPANTTAMSLQLSGGAAAGTLQTFDIGAVDAFNLTTLGLADLPI